jgi:hypothetical protein
MTAINLGTLSPVDEDVTHLDIKEAAFHVQPITLDTPSATPATTPDQGSPLGDSTMAGKKVFSLERPDDRARELTAKLTLEEQVRVFPHFLTSGQPVLSKPSVLECLRWVPQLPVRFQPISHLL